MPDVLPLQTEPKGDDSWREQWARVGRLMDELDRTYAGRPAPESGTSETFRDLAIHLFITITALGDVLGKSNLGFTRFSLDADHPAAKTCRDVANNAKHLKPTGSDMTGAHVTVMPYGPSPSSRMAFTITGGPHDEDARAVAKSAVDAWGAWIASREMDHS